MAFSRLAPHCGLTPVYGHTVGICDMRGGFSWSSLGNTFTSGLKNIGSFLSNTAHKIGQSEGFQQAKQGFLRSGILENAGSLAGQTLNSLVDIGRLNVERDLEKLRQKALGENNSTLTQEQLRQILASLPEKDEKPLPTNILKPSLEVAVDSKLPSHNNSDSLIRGPVENEEPPSVMSYSRPRKRKRVSGWGAFLDDMTGDGVDYTSRRYCY
ncbi:pVI [Bovine adenovirus 7]|nr:pVI [Bovine adenovirus 7]